VPLGSPDLLKMMSPGINPAARGAALLNENQPQELSA